MSAEQQQAEEILWDTFIDLEMAPFRLDLVRINDIKGNLIPYAANILSNPMMIAAKIGMKWDQGWHKGTVISRRTHIGGRGLLVGANYFNAEFCNTVFPIQFSVDRFAIIITFNPYQSINSSHHSIYF